MKDYVADTHVLFWYFSNYPRLGRKASSAFEEAEAGNAYIHIPAIVLPNCFFSMSNLGSQ